MITSIINKDGEAIKASSDKLPIVVYTIADTNNFPYAVTMLKSFRHFHDWPVILYTNEKDAEKLKTLPKDITVVDLTPYLQDQMFFYRATPILSEPLLDQYECVLKLDADQLILGDLSYIKDTTDYDVGVVINWNRQDEKNYPLVQGWGIFPAEYFNCGLVALRSKKFAHDWLVWCHTPQFDRLQYKEQDGLNGMIYFGNWNCRCFDHPDPVKKYSAWHGIIGKGEWVRSVMKGKDVVVPQGLGSTPFPPTDIVIKVAHIGGGGGEKKDNWSIYFPTEVMKYINTLIK
jgi:hypothetical protein